MEFYLQTQDDPDKNKVEQLLTLVPGSQKIDSPPAFSDIPSDMALICVLTNALFEAAGLVHNEREYQAFTSGPSDRDSRPRTWLLMPIKEAHRMAGYEP